MMENELIHDVKLVVPLSGSCLFDIHSLSVASKICSEYPGLHYTCDSDKRELIISGKLNDYWFAKWNKDVFEKIVI